MEEGLLEEELARRDPPRPVQSGLGAEGTAVLAAATRAACPGAPCLAPRPVMTLRPSLIPLRLLLLLLLSGAVCRADAGFETESPVRTLQVETLVRRGCPGAAAAGPWEGRGVLNEPGSGEVSECGNWRGSAGCRGRSGISGGGCVTPVVRS